MTRGSLRGDRAPMATAGETITDPVTGERCHWLVTASQTGGRLVRAEWWAPPGTGARAPHLHRRSEERLEVLAGRLTVLRGGERLALGAGDGVRLPARVPHAWWNESADEVHLVIEISPAGHVEDAIAASFTA
jgi:mannose-6-phosphate isomerase-like protein (cupin superfamily)